MANKIGAKVWSRDELRLLRRLHADGLSDEQIAKQLGRTTWSVGNRRRKFGLVCNNVRRTRSGRSLLWSESEDAVLRAMHDSGSTDAEISLQIGRSANACRIRRHFLGITPAQQSEDKPAPRQVSKTPSRWTRSHNQDEGRQQRIADARAINEIRRQEAFRRQFGRNPSL